MPAAAVLLAGRGVLHAADVPERLLAQDADVGACAFADLVEPAIGDLAGQERVGDGLTGGADQVHCARPDDVGHQVRAGVAADGDDRLRGRLADTMGPRSLASLGVVTGGTGVLRPGADVDVPQVDQVVGHRHQLEHLVGLDAGQPVGPVHGDPGGDRAVGADRCAHRLQGLQPEPAAAGQAAAIAVGPPVRDRGQELGHQVAMRAVHVDDVEARAGGAPGGLSPVPLHPRDVGGRHLLGQRTELDLGRQLGRREPRRP